MAGGFMLQQPGNAHDESRAFLEHDVAAMRARDPAADSEAETASAAVARVHQSLEDTIAELFRNARSVIIDDDRCVPAFGTE